MPKIRVFYSSNFKRKVSRLNKKDKYRVYKKISQFTTDPTSPGLHTHKLSGKLKYLWSFSVSISTRIVFRFVKEGILLLDVGSHDIYK